MSTHCFTDGNKGILFLEDGEAHPYKLDDFAPGGDEVVLMRCLAQLFEVHPTWEMAFEKRETVDWFCQVDGHYEWDVRDGAVVCAECGEPAQTELGIRLVPVSLLDAVQADLRGALDGTASVEDRPSGRPPGDSGAAQPAPVELHDLEHADQDARRSR